MNIDYSYDQQTWTLPMNTYLKRIGTTFSLQLGIGGILIELGTAEAMEIVSMLAAIRKHEWELEMEQRKNDTTRFLQERATEFEDGTPT